jgi:hypothetical protein
MVFSGKNIEISRIRFFGCPAPSLKTEAGSAIFAKAEIVFQEVPMREFVRKDAAHEHPFESPMAVVGVRFPNTAWFGRTVVFELSYKGDRKVIPAFLAAPVERTELSYYLPLATNASRVKIWYSKVSPRAAQQLAETPPVLLCLAAGTAKHPLPIKKNPSWQKF